MKKFKCEVNIRKAIVQSVSSGTWKTNLMQGRILKKESIMNWTNGETADCPYDVFYVEKAESGLRLWTTNGSSEMVEIIEPCFIVAMSIITENSKSNIEKALFIYRLNNESCLNWLDISNCSAKVVLNFYELLMAYFIKKESGYEKQYSLLDAV